MYRTASAIGSQLLGLRPRLAVRDAPIQPLEGLKDLPTLLGDGPIPHLPVDQTLPEDIEVRCATRNAFHASGPLWPATVIDGQVLLDGFDTRPAARQVSLV
jgi:hypothetical protein